MPCRTRQGKDSIWDEERHGTNDPDKLRDMLCRLCFAIEVANGILPVDVQKWYEKHEAWDKEQNNDKPQTDAD